MLGVQRSSAVMVDTVVPKTRMDWLTETYHNTPGGSNNEPTLPSHHHTSQGMPR